MGGTGMRTLSAVVALAAAAVLIAGAAFG